MWLVGCCCCLVCCALYHKYLRTLDNCFGVRISVNWWLRVDRWREWFMCVLRRSDCNTISVCARLLPIDTTLYNWRSIKPIHIFATVYLIPDEFGVLFLLVYQDAFAFVVQGVFDLYVLASWEMCRFCVWVFWGGFTDFRRDPLIISLVITRTTNMYMIASTARGVIAGTLVVPCCYFRSLISESSLRD